MAELSAHLAPWLSLPDLARAMAFYAAAFGAVERYRLEDNGRVVVAQLAVGEADFWVQEEPDLSVPSGGGPIRMILTVDDPDALFAQALAAGAVEIAAIYEGFGWRIGRVADPFGFHWEIGMQLT